MRRSLVVIVFSVLLAGCGAGPSDRAQPRAEADPDSTPTRMLSTEQTGIEVEDRSFVAVTAYEGDVIHPFLPGTRVTVGFERRPTGVVARWSGGCNISGVSVDLSGGWIALVGEQDQTLVGCGAASEEQDRWVSALMEGRPAWRIEDEHLVIESSNARLHLAPDPATPPCVGTVGVLEEVTRFIGLTEEAALASAQEGGYVVRILGRDGRCEDRELNYIENRLNVYILDGTVVTAFLG